MCLVVVSVLVFCLFCGIDIYIGWFVWLLILHCGILGRLFAIGAGFVVFLLRYNIW